MKWHYKQIFIDRKEAEKRIKALNFKDANRGWELVFKDKTQRRIHIVPSADYMEVHQDVNTADKKHKVVKNQKARMRCENIIKRLNKHNRLKVFIKRLLQRFNT